jgi:hypothetical protein
MTLVQRTTNGIRAEIDRRRQIIGKVVREFNVHRSSMRPAMRRETSKFIMQEERLIAQLENELQAAGQGGGSIGSATPSFDSRNLRVKGFSMQPIRSRDGIRRLFADVAAVEQQNPASTRTTVRAFVRRELVEGIRGNPDMPYDIEAVVPVDNAMPGYSMTYFGRNSRVADPEVFAAELESVEIISRIAQVSRRRAIERVSNAGYSISVLENPDQSDVNRMLELYNEAYQLYTFEINSNTIRDMLNDGNVVLVARDMDGQIASSLIAEHCVLNLEGREPIHLYELSDYATFRTDRGNGLITAMQIEVVNILRAIRGEEAIIYAEDRAAWRAVNISSVKAGMNYCGTLPLHCLLVSDRDFDHGGQFESLNVFAVAPGGLNG